MSHCGKCNCTSWYTGTINTFHSDKMKRGTSKIYTILIFGNDHQHRTVTFTLTVTLPVYTKHAEQ